MVTNLAKQFVMGNRYVFVYKKWKRDMLTHGASPLLSYGQWPKLCNGRTVKFSYAGANNRISVGQIEGYYIIPIWCKCIGKEGIK